MESLSPSAREDSIMLLGTWHVALDDAGRLVIPAALRAALRPGLVVTRGFDRCLHLCPEPFWHGLAQRVRSLTLSGFDERLVRRLLFAEASPLRFTKRATITITAALRAYAGLDRAGILVGMDQYLELWSPERWQECQAMIAASAGRWSRRDWSLSF